MNLLGFIQIPFLSKYSLEKLMKRTEMYVLGNYTKA